MTSPVQVPAEPQVMALGDEAVLVRLGTSVDSTTFSRVRDLVHTLEAASLPGVLEIVPAYASVALYMSDASTRQAVMDAARFLAGAPSEAATADATSVTTHVIPVRYDGADLESVAEACDLTVSEVVRRHSSRTYDAFALGFVPGFAYLGVLDESLRLPRRPQPRTRVPAGSVAIAGAQTAIYPFETPGGWHLIGRTAVSLFDASRARPALIAAGDRVRFMSIDGA